MSVCVKLKVAFQAKSFEDKHCSNSKMISLSLRNNTLN